MDRKRITSNGIHHLVKDAQHDKDPKIREVFDPEGFSVLELTTVNISTYNIKLSRLDKMETYLDNKLPKDANPKEIGSLWVIQHFLESQRRYISHAVFSTSVDNNPQVSGNLYRDKE